MTNELIAVIDMETTGLSPWRNDRIVEIGILVMTPNGIIKNEYSNTLGCGLLAIELAPGCLKWIPRYGAQRLLNAD
jgi:DNA polymerase III epsilon subunit-like protein